jgi:polyhydroxyalkanoate synthase
VDLRVSTESLENPMDVLLPSKQFMHGDTVTGPVGQPVALAIDQGFSTLYSFETLDRVARATTARVTQGVSPHAQMAALLDWTTHLSRAPGRQLELTLKALASSASFAYFAAHNVVSDAADRPFEPAPSDRRFADAAWRTFPFVLFEQAFLAQEDWWKAATHEVRGMTPNNAARVSFMALQLLDVFCPSNALWLNPVVIDRTKRETGANLVRGWMNFVDDAARVAMQLPPKNNEFHVGEDVATTPGQGCSTLFIESVEQHGRGILSDG